MKKLSKISYMLFSFESNKIPDKLYHLVLNSTFVFPSRLNQSVMAVTHGETKLFYPCFGIVVYNKDGLLTLQFVLEKLDNLCTCFSLVCGETQLLNEFLNVTKKISQDIITSESRQAISLESAVNNLVRPIFKPTQFHLTDFSKIDSAFLQNAALNFISIFNKYLFLDKEKETFRAIKLLVFINHITPLTSRLYDNANLKFSLMHTLLESIMPSFKVDKKYTCKKCGAVRNVLKDANSKARFSSYVDKLPITEDQRSRAIRTFDCMLSIRNEFYHEAKYYEQKKAFENLANKVNKSWADYSDDFEYNEGRAFGPQFVLDLISIILLQRVSLINSNNNYPEFEKNKLWEYFYSYRITESICIRWGNFVVDLHSVIRDYADLAIRISQCQTKKTCANTTCVPKPFLQNQVNSRIVIVFPNPEFADSSNISPCSELQFLTNSKCGKAYQTVINDVFKSPLNITYLVKCKINNIEGLEKCIIEGCGQFFGKEIEFINPTFVFAVGRHVFIQLQSFPINAKVILLNPYLKSLSFQKNIDNLKNKWQKTISNMGTFC